MKPLVAIVGRPNVGKSTLLNRLAGKQVALVADWPGVTRDRLFAEARLGGREVLLVDTGGFDPRPQDELGRKVVEQARAAIEEAQAVLLVCDGLDGPHPLDGEMASLLRRAGKPVFCAVNKVDPGAGGRIWEEFFGLGLDTMPISALHGSGLEELAARLGESLGGAAAEPGSPAPPADFSLCLLGRPNVGKSSLANRLLGHERQIVSESPGTTRDAVDIFIERDGARCLLVDTPGVRRRTRIEQQLEQISVMAALRRLDRSDVAALLLDATEPVSDQDARLAHLVQQHGKGLLLVLNKMDRLAGEARRREAMAGAQRALRFVSYAPLCAVSALTGAGVEKILPLAREVKQALGLRLTTGQLNRLVAELTERHPPPISRGRRPRIFFISQVATAPPIMMAKVSQPQAISPSYLRYLENRLREHFAFTGVPIRWKLRSHGEGGTTRRKKRRK